MSKDVLTPISANTYLPQSKFETANLVSVASLVFDRFPNAKRDVCGNTPFCRFFSFAIILHMVVLYAKQWLMKQSSFR